MQPWKQRTARRWALPAALGLGIIVAGDGAAYGQFRYVDANAATGGNTGPASAFKPGENNGAADNLWTLRKGNAFASGNTAYQAGDGENGENAPEIATTLSGLAPGALYAVYAHFMDSPLGTWPIRAGFTSGGLPLFAPPDQAAVYDAQQAVLASSLSYAVPPTLFTGGDRTMFAAPVGVARATGGGQITVYIDDMPSTIGETARTFYDGLSYAPANPLTLRVNLATGALSIVNNTGASLDMNYYEIRSATGALNAAAWNSLDDQDASNGAAAWRETSSSTATLLSEFNVLGGTTFAAAEATRLGSVFDRSALADLTFSYSVVGEDRLQPGFVELVPGIAGDFDDDDDVDGNDFLAWQRGESASPVSSGDLADWRANFGAPASPAAAVPEPHAVALALAGSLALIGRCWVSRSRAMIENPSPSPSLRGRGIWGVALLLALAAPSLLRAEQFNQVAGELITLNDNGAWSWYMDERVVIDQAAGKLLASSVADNLGSGGAPRSGDIDVVSYDLGTAQLDRFVLHDNLQADDHNGAALLVRPDGRYLAVYTKHNSDKLSLYRVSTNPHDATSWRPEQEFNWASTPGSDFNATYSNLFYLSAENRTYNFARANNRSPNMMISTNQGDSWTYGGRLLATTQNVGYVNGYLKYASNGVDRIDFIATEHHPRDFNNNIYHGYIQGGKMYRSDGSLLDGNIFDNVAPAPTALTQVFDSDPEDGSQGFTRAWTTDLHVDDQGRPYAIFTTRADDVPVNSNGYNDHRFFYARYDGSQWNVHQLAKAGARLYSSEQDYTGLVALDPHDPDTLYMSSTIDPRDGENLAHHEIFKGVTADLGATWAWTPITFNSNVDNLRPTVPLWDGQQTALVWMRGTYSSMLDYDLDIVALTEFGPLTGPVAGDLTGDRELDLDDVNQLATWLHSDLDGLSAAEAYAHGDLNGDGQSNALDFFAFRQLYDAEHGVGALERALLAVPEPGAAALAALAALGAAFWVRR